MSKALFRTKRKKLIIRFAVGAVHSPQRSFLMPDKSSAPVVEHNAKVSASTQWQESVAHPKSIVFVAPPV